MNDVRSPRTKNIASTSTTTALVNTSSPGKFIHKIQREEALILAQRAIEEQKHQRKENEVKNIKVRAYLLQSSSSESEDSDSNASTKPAGPLNTKKFHRRVMEELKGNFFRVELQFTHKKMAEQKLQRMEILNAEHCAWLMVLAKTRPEFDHNLFLRRYPEMISNIVEIREIVGFRLVEWDNSNPRDPVRIVKNQLATREKLQCQNFDDNDVQPNSNKASKHDTSEESLTGNADDNEVQPNSTDALKDATSEESPKGNGKRSIEDTFGNFCKKFKFWNS